MVSGRVFAMLKPPRQSQTSGEQYGGACTFTSPSLVNALFLEHFPSTPWVLVNTLFLSQYTVPGTNDPSHLTADLDE